MKYRNWMAWSAFASALLVSHEAAAGGVYLEASIAPVYSRTNTSVSGGGGTFAAPEVKPETGLGYDLRGTLGYTFWDHLIVGGSLNVLSSPSKRDAVAGGAESLDQLTKNLEYGPTLGFVTGGFRILLTAIGGGNKTITDRRVDSTGAVVLDTKTVNRIGLGFQITTGYSLSLAGNLKIGPSLVYRNVNYRSQTYTDNADASNNYTDRAFYTRSVEGSLVPMISLGYQF